MGSDNPSYIALVTDIFAGDGGNRIPISLVQGAEMA